MEWVERMNKAVDCIEERLMGDVDYAEAARAACCSLYHFQRMFAFIAGVPLSEYVRRRRLTLAAMELQNSTVKVVDLGLRYGYDSPEAFTRAFQQLHGTTPTASRQPGTKLKAYPPMSFRISIQGASELNYRIEQLPAFAVAGVPTRVATADAFTTVPRIWQEALKDGLFERLWKIRRCDHPMRGILGVCSDGDWGKNDYFQYIMAVVYDEKGMQEELPGESASEIPEKLPRELVRMELPSSTWVVFETGGNPDGVGELWQRLYTDWVPNSTYELAYLPGIECFLPPEEERNELWIPVVRRG